MRDTKLERMINEAIRCFQFKGTFHDFRKYGNGHINDTFLVRFIDENGKKIKYILQRINSNVFKKPAEVMSNIIKVTEHLKKAIEAYDGDPERETLTVIKTKSEKRRSALQTLRLLYSVYTSVSTFAAFPAAASYAD